MSSTSTPDAEPQTRARIVSAAMELFGRQGFKATTIAQIEAAAGLSPGSGGTYRHFRSKREVLEAGLRQQFDAGGQLLSFIDDPARLLVGDLRERLVVIARAGLRRLQSERDVNRLLLRDLADFPDLLDAFREQELQRVYAVLAGALEREVAASRASDGAVSEAAGADRDGGVQTAPLDVPALAAVLISAVSHYWVLTDVFGAPPMGVDEERFLGAVADVAAAALGSAPRR